MASRYGEHRGPADPLVAVIIPVYFGEEEHVRMTWELVIDLLEDPSVAAVYLQFNGGSTPWIGPGGAMLGQLLARDKRVAVHNDTGANIYAMWNHGCQHAVKELGDGVKLAILNNDLVLAPSTITSLAAVLDVERVGVVYPDYDAEFLLPPFGIRDTTGTFRSGGMSGFCFMTRGAVWQQVPFDEEYNLWYGDDDFELRVRNAGWRVCRVTGLPIIHLHSRTLAHRPDLLSRTEEDRQRFTSKFKGDTQRVLGS